ncbi:MAG: MlaD family protein [Cyanobacteria bacterium J06632_3]
MRARTIREGSVGLLILLGIGLFGGLVLWLRGFNPSNRPYQLIAEFEDTAGVQVGTPVMYRGVSVGRVMSITPRSNRVELSLEITEKDLRMPNQVLVETVESGLIGEMSIEITPLETLATNANELNVVGKGCDSSVILCDGDRLTGETGPSYEALLRSTRDLTQLYADPELLEKLKTLLDTVATTTTEAGELAQAVTLLTQQSQAEIAPLSNAAQTAVESATLAARQVESTVQQFEFTATDINSLIGENRGALVDTLSNLQAASSQLRVIADSVGPTFQSGQLVGDLEALVNNAAAASADLQAVTSSFNNPANLMLLQQTLESARDALASAQKVMADVDEITGDPAVRLQIRNLINGLGGLVSSTQSLEEQSEIAQLLAPLGAQVSVADRPLTQELLAADQSADDVRFQNSTARNSLSVTRSLVEGAQTSERPVLVFDGERYVLRSSSQLAERSKDKSLTKTPE